MALETGTLPVLAKDVVIFGQAVNCWWTVVYVGVVSVAMGYTLQALGQKHSPAADAAIVLSMEAVFAAVFGYLALHESLTPRQLLGCVAILAAIVVVQSGRQDELPP